MACDNCNDTNPISLTGSFFPGSPCMDNPDCSGAPINGACVYYNGPNLSCSGILTLDSMETALQKIDEQICAIIGDYSTYTMNCLPDWWGSSITTQAQFVDAITSYVCTLNTTADTFINNTFVTYQTTINNIIETIQFPGITCASASVTDADDIVEVLTKYCTKFTEIDDAIDVTSVDWNNCFTVVSPPTTIAGGLQLAADQICLLYGMLTDGDALPTFNNYTNCLAGTSSDSLVTTIGLIITKLCAAPVFDNDDLTSTCITIPGDSTDLTTLIQNIIDAVDASTQNYVTFDGGDFTVTATDPMDPCAGITVTLATPPTLDRFVAVSAGDTSPSTLIDKIASASNTIEITNNANTTLNLEIAEADYGDISVTSSGTVWTIDNDVVTYAKMQNIAASRLVGRYTASSGDMQEISVGAGLDLSTGGVLSATAANTLSGRYVPGLTNTTNIASSASYTTSWFQVGDMVTVFGALLVTTTGAGATEIRMATPITSGLLGDIEDMGGTAADPVISDEVVSITATGGADTAVFKWVAAGAATYNLQFQFSYYVTAP